MKRFFTCILATVFCFLFFGLYTFLYWPSRGDTPLRHNFLIMNQPDEVANYFFIRELALNRRIAAPEPLSQLALNQLHPRSMTVVFGNLTAIGFPGVIVIYGVLLRLLVSVFGSQIFNWLAIITTPLLALAGAGFLYGLVKRIFSARVAALSAVLLLISPPWWYYASRPMQHNTLFVFFLLGFLYFFTSYCHPERSEARSRNDNTWLALLCKPKYPAACRGDEGQLERYVGGADSSHKKPAQIPCALGAGLGLFFSALSFGLAIFVRPSELVWLSVIFAFLLLLARKSINWRGWLAIVSGLALTAILFFSAQIAVYGAPFGSGYVKPSDSGEAGQLVQGPQGLSWLEAVLLPFGFHPNHIWQNFQTYFWGLWPWWSVAAILGLAMFIYNLFFLRQRDSLKLVYFAGLAFAAVYLLVFYGSWSFFDNLARVPSIASSHVRYFLPLYALSTPLAALFLDKLWSGQYLRQAAAVLVLIILLGNSFNAVYFAFDGLVSVKASLAKYYQWQKEIYNLVPENGVVLTRYADKYIWPGRRVIAGWARPEQLQAAANLASREFPVFFYDLALSEQDENTLKKELAELGLILEKPVLKLENLELRPLILIKK